MVTAVLDMMVAQIKSVVIGLGWEITEQRIDGEFVIVVIRKRRTLLTDKK